MAGDRWQDWPPPSRPRRVEGGIKARSKRGAIGEQWWSRRFTGVLESLGMSGRLARGRSYARSGQVLGLEVSAGRVSALVQGSRVKPYKVKISVLPLTSAQWDRVQRSLAEQALFRAKLLAGEMPKEIEQVFTDCGTPLFPKSGRDLDMSCSCPDWEVPCKHLAAVLYMLAERFDDDPFAVLAWRGRDRDQLLESVRRLISESVPEPTRTPGAFAMMPLGNQVARGSDSQWVSEQMRPGSAERPLADCIGDFWSAGLRPARLRARAPVAATPAGPVPPDLLLRITSPPDLAGLDLAGLDLAGLLTPAYLRLAGDIDAADE